jgi:hypothetical protein
LFLPLSPKAAIFYGVKAAPRMHGAAKGTMRSLRSHRNYRYIAAPIR